MYSLYIGSLCNVVFPMARFTCILTSHVFVEIWMRWSIALSSAFYTGRKHSWIVFSFKIITKARRHICSLYAYITSLQHNIIRNFFVMKYNLPTNLLFLLSLETQWRYVFYHSFLQWFINKFMYDTLVFLSFLPAYTVSLHCLTTVWCMVNFRPMHG